MSEAFIFILWLVGLTVVSIGIGAILSVLQGIKEKIEELKKGANP